MYALLMLLALGLGAASTPDTCGNIGIPQLFVDATVSVPGTALISPAGTAPSLAEQGLAIQVGLFDCIDQPIAGYPGEDIWIDDAGDGSVSLCRAGSVADAATGPDGWTTISHAIAGGGASADGTQIWVAGMPVDPPPLPLDFVSPDLDGDLVVDLGDFGWFGQDFGSAARRSDLLPDGIVDLADFGVFGVHFGESCP